ncbi:hypothetical protein B0H19DRAFT_1060360 [Mycena capillaripes]|nr:hypothetical protein B0H19DRAFT_1060360 [Mycena capillaripes]
MYSSVSSKWAFSSAGINISKRHNWLNPDIVEALRGLKCMIKRNLNFRKSALVDDGGTYDLDDSQKQSEGRKNGWDSILTEESDNHDPDHEMEFKLRFIHLLRMMLMVKGRIEGRGNHQNHALQTTY